MVSLRRPTKANSREKPLPAAPRHSEKHRRTKRTTKPNRTTKPPRRRHSTSKPAETADTTRDTQTDTTTQTSARAANGDGTPEARQVSGRGWRRRAPFPQFLSTQHADPTPRRNATQPDGRNLGHEWHAGSTSDHNEGHPNDRTSARRGGAEQ